MAKVSLTKLGLKVNQDIKNIEFNEQIVEVKQYLPVNDKLELIGNVINLAHDENNFSNPVKVSVFTTLEIMYAYTNVNFTDKQKEDAAKLYDIVVSSGLVEKVLEAIPEEEYASILNGVAESIEAIYAYKNSLLGVIEAVTQDYEGLSLDANKIYSDLANPENMELLKGIMAKLG